MDNRRFQNCDDESDENRTIQYNRLNLHGLVATAPPTVQPGTRSDKLSDI